MDRKTAREHAMKAIYQADVNKERGCSEYIEHMPDPKGQTEYIKKVTDSWNSSREIIDSLIEKFLVGWTIERMPRVDLAILRLAVSEMEYVDEVPNKVSINEAVELAKKFGTEDAPKYINAILGKLERSR